MFGNASFLHQMSVIRKRHQSIGKEYGGGFGDVEGEAIETTTLDFRFCLIESVDVSQEGDCFVECIYRRLVIPFESSSLTPYF